jgi:arginase
LDLRRYVAWCTEHPVVEVFDARRADIECFSRHLESLGRARATTARAAPTLAAIVLTEVNRSYDPAGHQLARYVDAIAAAIGHGLTHH